MIQRKHILNALDFIRYNSDFASLPNDQTKFVSSAYSNLKEASDNKWKFEIPLLEVPISNKELKRHSPTLLIGGLIEGRRDEITRSSFSISITFTTESSTHGASVKSLNTDSCCLDKYMSKKRVVRRFHFDFQPNDHVKPASHFQYGGKFPESEYIDCHYCLEHYLETPRFHYPPMDLVLLLDLIIREFETPLRKLTYEPVWKGLVIKSEELWWKDYWNRHSNHFGRLGTRCTLHEQIYGES